MVIRVLSSQLANQIAAGEVVERPVSVVKELVENSIDAGADQIDIEIEKGGSQLIRVRDNGSGIDKAELSLALARHATSKIVHIDDLSTINSLGFRGEALASIGSVSRLILTSRTKQQSEGWQIYKENDSEPLLRPVAHPIGSTVEVSDLFHNIPVRRRFLKSDKTEFAHIDETVKRIALVASQITINLQHNNKLIRQYRATRDDSARERRLAAVFSPLFMSNAIKFEWQHDDLKIEGWVATNVKQHYQYFYVNNRIIRDRLLSHAIKQAHNQHNNNDNGDISYVIYLYVDPHQIDVNVHPTKHEIRFYHARLVHDFVYQAVLKALDRTTIPSLERVYQPLQSTLNEVKRPTTIPLDHRKACELSPWPTGSVQGKKSIYQQQLQGHQPINDVRSEEGSNQLLRGGLNTKEQSAVESLLFPKRLTPFMLDTKDYYNSNFGRVISLLSDNYAILQKGSELQLLSLASAQKSLYLTKLTKQMPRETVELLVPVTLELTITEKTVWQQQSDMLHAFNFDFRLTENELQLLAIPILLREIDLSSLVSSLLVFLQRCIDKEQQSCREQLADWLVNHLMQCNTLSQKQRPWTQARVVTLLTELELLAFNDDQRSCFVQPIDLTKPMALLQDEK